MTSRALRHKEGGAINRVTGDVIDAAIRIHRDLGPGLFESTYETCLARALEKRGRRVQRQVVFPLWYDGEVLDAAYRVDMIVDEVVIVELKAVDAIHEAHGAQILTYLKLSGLPVGLLLNFNAVPLKRGIRRFVSRTANFRAT